MPPWEWSPFYSKKKSRIYCYLPTVPAELIDEQRSADRSAYVAELGRVHSRGVFGYEEVLVHLGLDVLHEAVAA